MRRVPVDITLAGSAWGMRGGMHGCRDVEMRDARREGDRERRHSRSKDREHGRSERDAKRGRHSRSPARDSKRLKVGNRRL